MGRSETPLGPTESPTGAHSGSRQLLPLSRLLGPGRGAIGDNPLGLAGPVVHVACDLAPSGHAAWDELATWWLSRYKPSTQRTYATYLPRWNQWCAGRQLNPLTAR